MKEQWQKWFAWYPVRVPLMYSSDTTPGKYVWCKTIYRRPYNTGDAYYWEFGTLMDVIKYGR